MRAILFPRRQGRNSSKSRLPNKLIKESLPPTITWLSSRPIYQAVKSALPWSARASFFAAKPAAT
jgi:hypothetical protein